jgi:hypothetical protein
MTLAEAGEIFAYWERDPPAHLIVQTIARLFGWTPQAAPSPPRIDEIAASVPPGLAVRSGAAIGMPAPIFDLVAMRARNRARSVAIAQRTGAPPLSCPHNGA